MTRRRKSAAVIAMLGAVTLTAAACGGGGGSSSASGSSSSGSKPSKGGTLYYLTKRPAEHFDPQRVYIGRDISNLSRLAVRTLTTFPVAEGDAGTKIVADLATDTGQESNGGKTWKFTLKDGVKWEDGSAVTCEDVKYGVSRTFATDIITGGPNYAIQFLDIPTDSKGASQYLGPYKGTGQALFDKAVTCSGTTITFNLKKPVSDFNYATYLPAFAPFKKSQDKGAGSNFAVFSDGPYKLQGTWEKDKGGTFVRNDQWDPKTDNIRGAFPDKIVFTEGLATETVVQRIVSDSGNDKFAVTDRNTPSSMVAQVLNNPKLKSRTVNPVSPYVDYFTPNFKTLTNPLVRQALAVATDKTGWITAEGGSALGEPAQTLINPSVKGYKDFNAFNAPDAGDPAKAKQLLQQAGVPIPYPIKFTFNGGTPTTQKQAATMKAAWEKGGFKVTLNELTDTYYDVIQNPSNAKSYDITWAGWGADWPTGSTVIPPLFDGRINLSDASNGSDYGYYNDPTTNKAIDAAYNETDITKQLAMWGDLDEALAKQVAYIPIQYEKFLIVYGSGVKGYINNAGVSMYPDLGAIGVQ